MNFALLSAFIRVHPWLIMILAISRARLSVRPRWSALPVHSRRAVQGPFSKNLDRNVRLFAKIFLQLSDKPNLHHKTANSPLSGCTESVLLTAK
jgi:hypothetical protein